VDEFVCYFFAELVVLEELDCVSVVLVVCDCGFDAFLELCSACGVSVVDCVEHSVGDGDLCVFCWSDVWCVCVSHSLLYVGFSFSVFVSVV